MKLDKPLEDYSLLEILVIILFVTVIGPTALIVGLIIYSLANDGET